MANALASIQNKILPYMPEITQDRIYAATWAVTTIAFTALSYYAPATFFSSALSLTSAHVVLFNKAIREWDSSRHNQVKIWMITACVVASAFLTVMALHSTPFLAIGIKALAVRRGSDPFYLSLSGIRWNNNFRWGMVMSLLFFTLFTGVVGYGGSAARSLYQRGLELMKTATWEPMQAHMQNDAARNQVVSLWDKCQFSLGLVIDADTMRIFGGRIQGLLFKFIPEEQKKHQFDDLMTAYQSVVNAAPEQAQEIWPYILENFKNFSVEKQLEFLPQLVQIRPNVLDELDQATQEVFRIRQKAVGNKDQTFLADCQAKIQALYGRIDAIKDARIEADAVEKISADMTQLCNEINQHCNDIKLYFPYRTRKDIKNLQTELMSGEKFKKLQRFNAQKAPADAIDLQHETDDYLLMQYEQMDKGTGVLFFNNLRVKLNVPQKEVYNKLNELGIGTIGEFIEKVLGNDRLLLKDKEEVLRRLETFLATKNGAHGWVYAALTGKVIEHSSYAIDLASRVAYKAAMILPVITSLIAIPEFPMCGAIAGMLYCSVPPFARRVDDLRARGLPNLAVHYFAVWYRIATRRPLFTLLTTFNTGEMATYASADTLGKLRILAFEFWLGVATQSMWSIFTGIALSREISDLVARRWRRTT